ncbi:ABC transporter ATP-binding protein [Tabrizicola sp. WMC-M-20]|nr:ABC transporter ATP-binding protein [Tabrizicola sp. WMC-M-20]
MTLPDTPARDLPPPDTDAGDGPLVRWFWARYLRPESGLLALAFLIMVIEGSTLGALSYMLEPLFDRVFGSGGTGALWLVGGAIFGLFAVRAVTSLTSKTLLARVSQRVAARMQGQLLAHLLRLDMRFFQDNSPGALIERVQGDTMAVQGIWISLVSGIGRDVVALIGLFAVAVSIDPWWTLAALIGTPLLILPAAVLRRYLRRKAIHLRNQAGERATRLDEIFHGIQAVKLNRMEAHQTARFDAILSRIVSAETKAAFGRAVLPSLVDLITGFGFLAVLMLGGREVAAGTRSTGEFMAFFSAMVLTFQPIRRLGDMAGLWQIGAASLHRIAALFGLQPSHRRPAVGQMPATLPPALSFADVHFGYGDQPVLRGLSFTAEAGKLTALVGPSGAGKSTVFHLLTGLSDPASGMVAIDGIATTDMGLDDQRALFAAVSQDAALFDESLRDNLTLGRQGISAGQIDAVLATAQAAGFVGTLPQGADTPAGPRGSNLSGGQRQRIAIARALLRDTPVLLLDEATSALDAASEAALATAMAQAAQGRTTLVIAHRLATVRSAHRIIVMDQGRAVETGTHAELLAQGGLYANLYALQFKDEGTAQ